MTTCAALLAAVLLAAPADKPADKPAAGQPAPMDLSTMGPPSRKVKDEKAVKKEIEAFFKQEEEAMKKADQQAMLAGIDFPVFMVTDDSKGAVTARLYDRDEYVALMKPFWENMPKDITTTHKRNVSVLSDALATVVDDFTMTRGKQKVSGKSHMLLVKRDGKWMYKTMVEAGWGDSMQQPPPEATTPAPAE